MTVAYIGLGILLLGFVAVLALLGRASRSIRGAHHALAELRRQHDELAHKFAVGFKALSALALGQVAPEKAVDRLLPALAHEEDDVSAAAVALLARTGAEAVEPIARAVDQGMLSVSRAMAAFHSMVMNQSDILRAAQTAPHSDEFCKALLAHSNAGTELFDWAAANASCSVLSCLVTLDRTQGTPAQAVAQERLRKEAERLRQEEEEAERESLADAAAEYHGPCFCRWQ